MASGLPGGNFRTWTPTPPERGSFPLDHDGECVDSMNKYLRCMKFTGNKNAPNCRILAKEYLGCRMLHDLMEQSSWDSLGLVNLPGDKTTSSFGTQLKVDSPENGADRTPPTNGVNSHTKSPQGGTPTRDPGGPAKDS